MRYVAIKLGICPRSTSLERTDRRVGQSGTDTSVIASIHSTFGDSKKGQKGNELDACDMIRIIRTVDQPSPYLLVAI